jgi:flavin-dependent dehydrogenase
MAEFFDIVIVGGWPAGSTAGTLLAKHGWNVAIFEKENFPRFKIGESLLPGSLRTYLAYRYHSISLDHVRQSKYTGSRTSDPGYSVPGGSTGFVGGEVDDPSFLTVANRFRHRHSMDAPSRA